MYYDTKINVFKCRNFLDIYETTTFVIPCLQEEEKTLLKGVDQFGSLY